MDALPKGAHYVGNTALSLEHIRNFNAERCVQYLLHDNDCRHYVNDLCAHLCPNAPEAFPRGVASKVSWQSAWQRVRGGRPHEALVVLPLQVFADVNNAPAVQRMKHAASASFAFGLGMRVVPYLAPTLGLRSGVAAALGTFTRAAPTRRLVTTAAGAFAGVSAETPVVREAIVLGGAAVGGAIDVTRGVCRRAGANLLAFAADGRRAGGRRTGCPPAFRGVRDLDARGVGRGDGRGRVRGEREGWRVCLQRRRVARRGRRRRRRRSVAPRRRFMPRSRGAHFPRRAVPRIASASWARTPDGTRRGGFVTWLGASGASGALPSTVSSASLRPRGARRGWARARARAPRTATPSGRARRSGVAEEEGIAGCAPRVAVRRPRGSVREGAAVRRAARLREGALRREPRRRQRRGVVDAVTVRARRDVFKLLISIRLPRTPSTTTYVVPNYCPKLFLLRGTYTSRPYRGSVTVERYLPRPDAWPSLCLRVALEAARVAPLTRHLAPRTVSPRLSSSSLAIRNDARRIPNPRVNVSPPPAPSPRPPPRALCDLRSRLSRVPAHLSPARRVSRRTSRRRAPARRRRRERRARAPPPGLLGRAPRLLRVFFTASAFSAAQGESKRRRLRLRPARPRARLYVFPSRDVQRLAKSSRVRFRRRGFASRRHGVGDGARGDLPVDAILLELSARASERGVHSLGARGTQRG